VGSGDVGFGRGGKQAIRAEIGGGWHSRLSIWGTPRFYAGLYLSLGGVMREMKSVNHPP
jgi:hypothetical protein